MKETRIVEFKGEKVTVPFPNVGQMIDMESLKQALTNGQYGIMAASGVRSMNFALDLVDAIVFLQIMCPAIATKRKIENYTSIPVNESKEIVDLYKKQIWPWYGEILKDLYGIDSEKPQETTGKSE
jgi:hypothetical protein